MDTKRKNSIKRQAILDALHGTKEHPTAEMLYNELKPEISDLSLGTVYRNLSMFCDEGIAQALGKVNGKERFDGRTDVHSHFVCKCCGRVLDVDLPAEMDTMYTGLKTAYGYIPERYTLSFTGLCDRCSDISQTRGQSLPAELPA